MFMWRVTSSYCSAGWSAWPKMSKHKHERRVNHKECHCLWWWGGIVSEKALATHSSTLAWKIPWTEEPGRLQSMGLLRVGQDWVTSLLLFTFMHCRRKWQPTPVFCLENPRDRGAWWAAVYVVAQSQTQLTRLSSSSRGLFT